MLLSAYVLSSVCWVQASLTAAAAAGLDVGGDEHRWAGPCSADVGVLDLVNDPVTRMFWRNVQARVSGQALHCICIQHCPPS